MKVSCPNCNSSYMIDDSKIPEKGAIAKCKKCNNKIFVKKDLPELELEVVQTKGEHLFINKDDDGKQSPVVDSDIIKCPHCAEVIKNEAIKCKHCGSILKADKTKIAFTERITSMIKSESINFNVALHRNKSISSKFFPKTLTTVLGILVIMGISVGLISGSCSGNSEMGLVKNGYLDFNKSLKFGNAIDKYKYFESTEWKYFETDKKVKVVQITGKLKPTFFDHVYKFNADKNITDRDKALLSADVIIQCTINSDGKSFQVAHISANVNLKCNEDSIRESSGGMSWIKSIYADEEFNITGILLSVIPKKFENCTKKL